MPVDVPGSGAARVQRGNEIRERLRSSTGFQAPQERLRARITSRRTKLDEPSRNSRSRFGVIGVVTSGAHQLPPLDEEQNAATPDTRLRCRAKGVARNSRPSGLNPEGRRSTRRRPSRAARAVPASDARPTFRGSGRRSACKSDGLSLVLREPIATICLQVQAFFDAARGCRQRRG
jgi:hypothetical protein